VLDSGGLRYHRHLLLDCSFEGLVPPPQAAALLGRATARTEIHGTLSRHGDRHGVRQTVTAWCRGGDTTLYVVEVSLLGLFTVVETAAGQEDFALRVHGMQVLFPFTRQVVARLVATGGFPPLYLQPVDFAALELEKALAGLAAPPH
jgi:protein-export chaperone SecB